MEITTRRQLREIAREERMLYLPKGRALPLTVMCDERYLLWKYLKYMRHVEYYTYLFTLRHSLFSHCMLTWYTRKQNRLGNMLDVHIIPGSLGRRPNIFHKSIIIYGHVGDDCLFHGRNCIGNNTMGGLDDDAIPTIGDGVDIGVGANIIGNVHLASGIKIGANAVVTHSCAEPNTVLVGVPARPLVRKSASAVQGEV